MVLPVHIILDLFMARPCFLVNGNLTYQTIFPEKTNKKKQEWSLLFQIREFLLKMM